MDIVSFRQEFQPYLSSAIQEKLNSYSRFTDDSVILEFIQYSENLIGGGKCVRPYMSYLMYTGLGGRDVERILDLIVSIEVFHTFALIHDDVIDKGTLRHEHPTMHTYVSQALLEQGRLSSDITHEGYSQAILIGDLLFSWAISRFSTFTDLPHHKEAFETFTYMIDEVVVGQMLDVDMMTRDMVETSLIETKMKFKTAGYTFVRPMQIGAALAGYSQEMSDFCESFGIALGLAFQTQDDILDLVTPSEKLNKTVLSDIQDHQHTLLTQYVLENGSEGDKAELQAVWGTLIDSSQQQAIVNIFQRTGALEYASEMIQAYFSRARQAYLAEPRLNDESRQALEDLIRYIEQRSH